MARRIRLRHALAVAGGLGGVYFVAAATRPTAVGTMAVRRSELVQQVVAAGRVRSLSLAQLGVPVAGIVRRVLVREGNRIETGQPLLELEDREARAAVQQARAGLRQAEARRAALDQVGAAVADATRRSADEGLATAAREYERAERLVEAGARSAQDLDSARERLASAQSQLDIAQAQLEAATGSGTEVRTADATVAQARAAVALAEARLGDRRITAPSDGRVLTRSVEPGDAVQAGQVLFTAALDGPTQIVAVPDERNIARMAEGQLAQVSADAYPGEWFPARVGYVAPSIDANQGTVEVRLDVESPPSYLRPGMTVSIQIETARRAEALTVPIDALNDPWGEDPWLLVVRDGRLNRRPVRIGLRGDTVAEILDGLADGDLVALPPFGGLEPGDRARARKEN